MTSNDMGKMPVQIIDGVEYYTKPGGGLIIKSVWDNLYGIGRPKGTILPKSASKGKNPNPLTEILKKK